MLTDRSVIDVSFFSPKFLWLREACYILGGGGKRLEEGRKFFILVMTNRQTNTKIDSLNN